MARIQPNTGSTTAFYEDFEPKLEQKEEEGAHLFLVYLPEFSREQIRVIYLHTTRTVRVQGERPLGNNKRSRFNRTFRVPQNCIVDKIHAKFQDEIVTITIPKQTTSPPQPAAAPKEEGKMITPTRKWNSISEPPTKSAAHQKTSAASQTPQKPITEPEAQKGQVQVDSSAKETPKQSIQSGDRKTDDEEKRVDASSLSKGLGKNEEEVKEEISFIEKAKEMKNVAAAAMKTALEKEDRQLILIMGVAISVIVAIGAYFTYRLQSSANAID